MVSRPTKVVKEDVDSGDDGDNNEDENSNNNDGDDDYIFASLVNSETDNITLTYQTHNDKCDTLNDSNGDPVYYFKSPKKGEGEIWRSADDHRVGSWTEHSWHSDTLKFNFNWANGEWGFDPEKNSVSLSSGFNDGKPMKWAPRDASRANDGVIFTMDAASDDRPDKDTFIVTFDMTTFSEGELRLVKGCVDTQDQLDEAVTVAFAVMNRLRSQMQK